MSKRKQGRPAPQPSEPAPAITPTGGSTALLFAPAILGGALLLFLVQPLIARYVLPWFGGGPGVWATCMLFFQALLLGGYLYAHLSVKALSTRGQVILHLSLLAASLLFIPIIPAARWQPPDAANPAWRILLLLGVTIGLPYFVLSATSPLLQSWFVRARPGVSPYRLFALSNLGSLLALIAYPAVLEPFFTRYWQAWIWSIGLIVFAANCAVCAIYVLRQPEGETRSDRAAPAEAGGPLRARVWLWIVLPLVASILLLATTNTMTEDVAATPLLWVVPLALYLLTFIIAFDSPRWYPRRFLLVLLPICAWWIFRVKFLTSFKSQDTLLAYVLQLFTLVDIPVTLREQFVAYPLAMFAICLFCHGELATLKPEPSRLTAYYLCISVGGVLGGIFVAIVAPNVFNQLHELGIGVLAAAILGFVCVRITGAARWLEWPSAAFIAMALLVMPGFPLAERAIQKVQKVVERSRNFYGTLTVAELDIDGQGNPEQFARVLNHGRISHGVQFLSPNRRHEPTLYYLRGSGISFAIEQFPRQANLRVGLVGLGAGTIAAYGKPGDAYRFYEINPDVDRIAREHFTFLADSKAKVDVVLGDARLTLEREPDDVKFDVLVLDAFSGDSIPTHLLTTQAFDLYQRRLADDGVIAVHFSNQAVSLAPLLLAHADRLGMKTVGNSSAGWWMLMTRNEQFLANPTVRANLGAAHPTDLPRLWTDDYINLLQVLNWDPKGPKG